MKRLLWALLGGAAASGQAAPAPTQDVWVLDQNANQLRVHRADLDATPVATHALAGTGQARGFGFDADGKAFVCRGDEVRTYDGAGVATALFAGAAQGLAQTQDVAVRPGTNDVYVSAGATALASKIVRFDVNGAVVATLTHALLHHPRRLSWSADGTKLYVACNGNKSILSYDPVANTFTQVIDLTANNV
ncbi:MAG TPA: hypothetical protein VEI02_13605, partial [Planctomycetota bacterium]|nr:hypothetical protein [Planctomycetota bacterium]